MNWSEITIMIIMWIATLSGVALGGWLVYRTKRDPYDPLFPSNQKGESFNLDDGLGTGQDVPVIPKDILDANQKFQEQFDVDKFAAGIAEKAKK